MPRGGDDWYDGRLARQHPAKVVFLNSYPLLSPDVRDLGSRIFSQSSKVFWRGQTPPGLFRAAPELYKLALDDSGPSPFEE